MVERAMRRAREAQRRLAPADRASILEPMLEGRAHGLSYAALPHCDGLAESRLVWWGQRALLRRPLFDWLRRSTASTLQDVEPDRIDPDFAEPLRRMASLEAGRPGFRAAACRAADRLETGAFRPRHVLMHGDLWKGNVLIRRDAGSPGRRRWRERFVVIDWAGSESRGHAIYDLIRLAQSMALGRRSLRREVEAHCRLLGCELVDARSHLLCALGHLAGHLEYFPVSAFARTAESCWMALDRALGREGGAPPS
jgi:hypothetical protein